MQKNANFYVFADWVRIKYWFLASLENVQFLSYFPFQLKR